jgi:hypothetical protein
MDQMRICPHGLLARSVIKMGVGVSHDMAPLIGNPGQ